MVVPVGEKVAGHKQASLYIIILLGECSTLWDERERGTVHGGRIRLLPPEINWAHRMLGCRSPQLLAFSAGRAHTG